MRKQKSSPQPANKPTPSTSTKSIFVEIPADLHARFGRYCATRFVRKSEVIRFLLTSYLTEEEAK